VVLALVVGGGWATRLAGSPQAARRICAGARALGREVASAADHVIPARCRRYRAGHARHGRAIIAERRSVFSLAFTADADWDDARRRAATLLTRAPHARPRLAICRARAGLNFVGDGCATALAQGLAEQALQSQQFCVFRLQRERFGQCRFAAFRLPVLNCASASSPASTRRVRRVKRALQKSQRSPVVRVESEHPDTAGARRADGRGAVSPGGCQLLERFAAARVSPCLARVGEVAKPLRSAAR